jgi:hypothetical protein
MTTMDRVFPASLLLPVCTGQLRRFVPVNYAAQVVGTAIGKLALWWRFLLMQETLSRTDVLC